MHLKSLTLKGFKSFASATTLRFEPGITCVVGPNGSGKSNVVDAISWVLGEQGAKALRGGKMEDVIFAGTAGRPPLGRAEVTLTIDNTDGALPIDYTEVSITRRMFRDGASEYEINGSSCRLLDIQELLSDSGIGREMHVIVGQGQLDSVLQAKPGGPARVHRGGGRRPQAPQAQGEGAAEARRDAGQPHPAHRPHRRAAPPAQAARPAGRGGPPGGRPCSPTCATPGCGCSPTTWSSCAARWPGRSPTRARSGSGARQVERAAGRGPGPRGRAGGGDRGRRAGAGAGPRRPGTGCPRWRSASAAPTGSPPSGSGTCPRPRRTSVPAATRRRWRPRRPRSATRRRRCGTALEHDRGRLAEAVAERQELERSLAAAERALVAAVRAVADRREGLARLGGQVEAVRTRLGAKAEEIDRLAAAAAEARERAAAAPRPSSTSLQAEVGALDEGEIGLDERHEAAVAAYDAAKALVAVARRGRAGGRAGPGHLVGPQGRARARADPQGRRRGAARGRDPAAGAARLGRRAAHRTTRARGGAGGGARRDRRRRRRRLGGRRRRGAAPAQDRRRRPRRRSHRLRPDPPAGPDPAGADRAPGAAGGSAGAAGRAAGGRAVGARPGGGAAGAAAGAGPGAGPGRGGRRPGRGPGLVAHRPGLRAVTARGRPARRRLGGRRLGQRAERDRGAGRGRRGRDQAGRGRVPAAAAVAAELAGARRPPPTPPGRGRWPRWPGSTSPTPSSTRSPSSSAGSGPAPARPPPRPTGWTRPRAAATEAREQDVAKLADLEDAAGRGRGDPGRRGAVDRGAGRAAGPRRRRSGRPRWRPGSPSGPARSGCGRCPAGPTSCCAAAADRARDPGPAGGAPRGPGPAGPPSPRPWPARPSRADPDRRLAGGRGRRAGRRPSRPGSVREGELLALRTSSRELAGELDRLTDDVHRDEVARAEQRLRIEELETAAVEQYGVDLDALVAEYGPEQLVPPSAADLAGAEADGQRRARSRRRTTGRCRRSGPRRAERDLALLGKVNPLALEEFAALEERHGFLSTQLEDLKATRRDLLTVVREVDERIHDVFAAAYADVAREFEIVFATLFPGGEGRLRAHRPGRHAGHRHRGRGPAAGQEGQAAVAAVRRRAVADRGRAAGGDLPRPARRRSTCSTRSRRRSTTSTWAGCSPWSSSCARPRS